MTHYDIIKYDLHNNAGYGIKITKERVIPNISNKFSVVQKIVDTCNNSGVDFDQFDDVLENFMEDYETF